MVFGKIEYLNLLPFHLFMKRFLRYSQLKQSMHYHRGVPTQINKKFLRKKVDAAFISSVNSTKCRKPRLGIIAKKEVQSVLVIPGSDKKDHESATSNILAKILGQHGEVLIGDKALRYYLSNTEHIDLAKLWYERHRLPFVFATLCANKQLPLIQKIERNFKRSAPSIKIPDYILREASARTKIPKKEITNYLSLISYAIDAKSFKSLKKFLDKAKIKK